MTPSNPTQVKLAGDSSCTISTTFTQGTATTGVNSQPVLVSGGSGYTDVPTVTFSGGGGTGAAAYAHINANGQVIEVILTATGSGYTSTPTVVFSGGGGTGASATVTIGNVLVGQTWQFTVERIGLLQDLYLFLYLWKTTGGTYPYTMTNECLFGPENSAAAYPSLPGRATASGVDSSLTNWFTTATPKYPAILRFMPAVLLGSPGGASNVVDQSDLRHPNDFTYQTWRNLPSSPTSASPVSLAQHPTGQRAFSITAIRTYALSPTCISAISITNGGSGYTSAQR